MKSFIAGLAIAGLGLVVPATMTTLWGAPTLADQRVAISDGLPQRMVQKKSPHSVEGTLSRLERGLKAKGITVFLTVDHQKNAKSVGEPLKPMSVIIFGNPSLGTKLLQADPTLGLSLPMKALAYEDATGQVWLAYEHPNAMAIRHGLLGQEETLGKMTQALDQLTNAAIEP